MRGCRPGKTVTMTENEVKALCHKGREIFLAQPILLELEAPLKICGMLCPVCVIHALSEQLEIGRGSGDPWRVAVVER